MNTATPVEASKRYVILDALRGFALLGICMANFPEFSLYSFLSPESKSALATSGWDYWTQAFLTLFIDGKFYTIFSLLFGVGFSIIITNVSCRGGNAMAVFYRRMFFLMLIGFAHLMLIWSGDILMLYALMGMILPLFLRASDKVILWTAGFLLFLPVILDFIIEAAGISPSAPIVRWQWEYCDRYGITEENFPFWLRDAHSYKEVSQFLIQGAIVRLQEFVDGHRWFKVLGLFMIGLYIGRNRYYADLEGQKGNLIKISRWGLGLGLPLSSVYAWECMTGHPYGLGMHSLIYFVSVYLTSFGYIAGISLLYIRRKEMRLWKALAWPGKMALTCYIGQSLLGMAIFYGTGMGFGADTGLILVEVIAICVFIFEAAFSALWLKIFRFGPLEWIWRCLTYLRIFQIIKK